MPSLLFLLPAFLVGATLLPSPTNGFNVAATTRTTPRLHGTARLPSFASCPVASASVAEKRRFSLVVPRATAEPQSLALGDDKEAVFEPLGRGINRDFSRRLPYLKVQHVFEQRSFDSKR